MHSMKFNTCIAIKDTDISTVTLRQIKCAHKTNVWYGFEKNLNYLWYWDIKHSMQFFLLTRRLCFTFYPIKY